MRIVMLMKWAGVTKEQYQQARKRVNWEGNKPKGGVLHVATFDKKGLRVTDVWESADDFNTFVEKRLMPAVKQIGIKGEPEVEILPIHALYAPALSE